MNHHLVTCIVGSRAYGLDTYRADFSLYSVHMIATAQNTNPAWLQIVIVSVLVTLAISVLMDILKGRK